MVHVYDVRSGLTVERLKAARDVVTTVAFNPRVPQLVAGSLDGGVHFWNLP